MSNIRVLYMVSNRIVVHSLHKKKKLHLLWWALFGMHTLLYIPVILLLHIALQMESWTVTQKMPYTPACTLMLQVNTSSH